MKKLWIAVSFLTTLPPRYKGEWDEQAFSRAAVFYPFVGLLIGAAVAAVLWLLAFIHSGVAAFFAVLTGVVITGGLHLDGYMDLCDGVLASRGPERALEIMKDSHVGSFAVVGVVLLLLGKYALYSWLLTVEGVVLSVLAAFTFSRFMMVYAIIAYPSARETGLGHTVQRHVPKKALAWSLIIAVLPALIGGSAAVLTALPLSFLLMVFFIGRANRYFGGLTGDVYGAIAEIAEVVFLFVLLLCHFFWGTVGISSIF